MKLQNEKSFSEWLWFEIIIDSYVDTKVKTKGDK